MIELYIAEARQAEMALSERAFAFRREYTDLRRLDRLERALKSARGRLRMTHTN